MFKKAIIAVLTMAAGVATAGNMGPVCTPGNVTVPCVTKLWDFSGQALYLRSIYGAEKDFKREVLPLPLVFEEGVLPIGKEANNEWNWGYRLEGSYHFNTGNDVNINWTHYSTSMNPTAYIGPLIIPQLGLIDPLANVPFELISRNRIDQVNVVMGQRTDLSSRDKLRFYGGLQYVDIQSKSTYYYSLLLQGESLSLFDNTNYKGFGPVVGIDYAFKIIESLSLTANGGGSILLGTNRYQAGFVLSPAGLIVEQVFYRKKGIVPSLEAKLGLNYAHVTPIGEANIQVGYQVINYFNALEAQPIPDLLAMVQPVDYGLFGPYFGLKLIGDA